MLLLSILTIVVAVLSPALVLLVDWYLRTKAERRAKDRELARWAEGKAVEHYDKAARSAALAQGSNLNFTGELMKLSESKGERMIKHYVNLKERELEFQEVIKKGNAQFAQKQKKEQ